MFTHEYKGTIRLCTYKYDCYKACHLQQIDQRKLINKRSQTHTTAKVMELITINGLVLQSNAIYLHWSTPLAENWFGECATVKWLMYR